MIPRVEVRRLIRRMREGAHQPPLVLADDGHEYVLKLGHLDPDFPVCELLGSILAGSMGVLTPPVARVRVPDQMLSLVASDPTWGDLAVGHKHGECFGSRYLGPRVQRWTPGFASVTRGLPGAAARLIGLDLLIENLDRKTGPNPNVLWHEGQLVAIDHGQALPAAQGITESFGSIDVRLHAVWAAAQSSPEAFAEVIDLLPSDPVIQSAVGEVPPAWWSDPRRPEMVERALIRRRSAVQDTLRELAAP